MYSCSSWAMTSTSTVAPSNSASSVSIVSAHEFVLRNEAATAAAAIPACRKNSTHGSTGKPRLSR